MGMHEELYQFLSQKEFQDPETGNLFGPAYMYTYPPEEEYNMRSRIEEFSKRLKRPDNYIEPLVMNIYTEFISYLKQSELLGDSLLDLVFEKEDTEGTASTLQYLKTKANDKGFYHFLADKVNQHFQPSDRYSRVFLFLHGFGSIYPILRASVFINAFWQYIRDYKLILFYPGTYKNGNYYLFNRINDEHLYRATLINKFIKEQGYDENQGTT